MSYNNTIKIIIIFLCFNFNSLGQIRTLELTQKQQAAELLIGKYDSSKNYLGDSVTKYIGQVMYLKGHTKFMHSIEPGYRDFLIDYLNDDEGLNVGNVYKCCGTRSNYISNYEKIVGKYFVVLDVIKSNKYTAFSGSRSYYMKLYEKTSGDTLYYKYTNKSENSFPFIVQGYYEKQKKMHLGNSYHICNRDAFSEKKDFVTGKNISKILGDKWKCSDVVVNNEEFGLSLMFENSIGEKISLNSELFMENIPWHCTLNEGKLLANKFGKDKFNSILSGNVKIGYNKEMCKIAWGEPDDVNKTTNVKRASEQWVYNNGSYLYFTNGILTAIQN
jgi:hypothetical protein